MHIEILDNAQCSGCSACCAVCSKEAIKMKPDELGFMLPVVDETKCIDCGLCTMICPFHKLSENRPTKEEFNQHYFALRVNSDEQLLASQSGGAFYLLSQIVLNEHGVVYGASMDDDFAVRHIRAIDAQERDKMRGSKYVQSDISGIIKRVREDLKAGSTVLFSGTPCQIAGLKSAVSKELQNRLYTVDLVCNGVASPRMWRDYISYLSGIYGGKVESAKFRDKRFGWHKAVETYIVKGKLKKRETFMKLYHEHLMRRESCFECPFANFSRQGDLTIGDFWGIEAINEEFNDGRGLSLMIINSEKGHRLFRLLEYGNNCAIEECTKDVCQQPMLKAPVQKSHQFESLNKDYITHGFVYVAKKYGDLTMGYKIKRQLRILKNTIIKRRRQ